MNNVYPVDIQLQEETAREEILHKQATAYLAASEKTSDEECGLRFGLKPERLRRRKTGITSPKGQAPLFGPLVIGPKSPR